MSDNLDDFDETKRLAKEKIKREEAKKERDTLSSILAKNREKNSYKNKNKVSNQYLSLNDQANNIRWRIFELLAKK